MRVVTEAKLRAVLAGLPGGPRVVVSGNFATPSHTLAILDAAVAEYRLFALNAQAGLPDRPGVTLQLGIGAVPDAVLAELTSRRGLMIWSEMFSDGVLDLEKAGALDPDTPITASFAFGSPELCEWIDRNPRVRLLQTEKTNDPALIARQPRMVSVNGALQVDLYAQANASRVHGMIYSGFGGQTDFVVGALHSPGGHAIIALPSWHPTAGVSTVVPRLTGPVTSFQHSFIVSERGTAAIWGHDADSQAERIIDQVAHPSVREELREAGRDLGPETALRRARVTAQQVGSVAARASRASVSCNGET